MNGELFATLFLATIVASLLLTPLALFRRSWLLMWMAAALSLAASIITGFSIGPFIFLITAVQFAAAVALRWMAGAMDRGDPRGRDRRLSRHPGSQFQRGI